LCVLESTEGKWCADQKW